MQWIDEICAYMKDKFSVTAKSRVLQGFCDGHVRVLEVGVLANEYDRGTVKDAFRATGMKSTQSQEEK